MANDTNTSLRANTLNLGCSNNTDTIGYDAGWSNTGIGNNLYSPTIIPFYHKTPVDFIQNPNFTFVTVANMTTDPIVSFSLGKNLITSDITNSTNNVFALMYKSIEVVVTSANPDFPIRTRQFIYKTNINLTLGPNVFEDIYEIVTNSSRFYSEQTGLFADINNTTMLNGSSTNSSGGQASGFVYLNLAYNDAVITPPGNIGTKSVAFTFDGDLDKLIIEFRLRLRQVLTNTPSFGVQMPFKGYIKLS